MTRRSPFVVHLERDTRVANQHRWPLRFARLLGKISDAELAARAGVALTTVVKERRRRESHPPGRSRPQSSGRTR